MKRIEIRTVLPVDYRKIKGFFITGGVLRLFYEVKNLEYTGNLSWRINGKYNAIVYFSTTDIVWEIYNTNNKLKDKISVFLYPTGDDTGVNYPALTDGASPPHDGDFLLLRATSIPLHPQWRFHRTEPFCNAPCGRGVTEGLLSTGLSSPSP
ncbi:hypothetical protein [Saccharolobus islandicus]|uniref:hypothetical protein n=1 Tax=Saccharolobus islandicus TaxID=43080 RepID=UPI000370ADEE|nr:hypothetical protein [Sulfolobus islandicus]